MLCHNTRVVPYPLRTLAGSLGSHPQGKGGATEPLEPTYVGTPLLETPKLSSALTLTAIKESAYASELNYTSALTLTAIKELPSPLPCLPGSELP